MNVKVTIMIPTYNQEKYIGQAIESALRQKYSNLEIVISDDCSTDNTQEVVNQYLSDERVKYYKNAQNLGRVANYRKTLYAYATGDYVLNLDGDDWLLETDFISKAVELLDNNENMSCVLGDRRNYDDNINIYRTLSNAKNPYIKTVMNGNDFFIQMPKIGFIFSHFACLYKRELATKLSFYDKDILSSDSESINRLYINHDIGYLPFVVGVWREHHGNASHKDLNKKLENIKKYDYLYKYAQDTGNFAKNDLKKWLFENQTSMLSQDILYYLKRRYVILSFTLLKKTFSKDIWFGLKVFFKVLNRGIRSLYA